MVLVRTASSRRFQRVPTVYVLSRNKSNIRIFYLKIFIFGGKIISVFEKACFRNVSTDRFKAIPLLQQFFVCASVVSHYENKPIQIHRKFHLQKLKIFR